MRSLLALSRELTVVFAIHPEPLSYIEFMNLVIESTIPVTVNEGTNRLLKDADLAAAAREALAGRWPKGRKPALWDGHTAQRAAQSLKRLLGV